LEIISRIEPITKILHPGCNIFCLNRPFSLLPLSLSFLFESKTLGSNSIIYIYRWNRNKKLAATGKPQQHSTK
jgi:hypothetical protein